MIGIYKITSPTGRIYIGQSRDIERRVATYKRLQCQSQPKVYASFLKHGVENHSFQTLVECSEEKLNEWETYYINLFNCTTPEHLNCRVDGIYQIASAETREKISRFWRGRKRSEANRRKMSEIMIGKPSPKRGCKVPRESVEKQRQSLKGKMAGDKNPFFGKTHSQETKAKMCGKSKGAGGANVKAKIVLNLITGIYYDCAKEAGLTTHYKQEHFRAMLNGNKKNKTSFIYA